MPKNTSESGILTIKEVAEYLKVTERTIYRLAAAKKIPGFKVGGMWRFRQDVALPTGRYRRLDSRPVEEGGGLRLITAYHAKYYAHELTRRHAADGVNRLSQSLFDASVDLNPHQIEAALFALRNPLQEGVLLADEVGLGKTIEAALVVCQYWAERRRRLLVICPASLRKQWAQELQEKFAVPTIVVDAVSLRKQSAGDLLATLQRQVGKSVMIMSYQFAAKLKAELRAVSWDVVVIDEAHKLRNALATAPGRRSSAPCKAARSCCRPPRRCRTH